MTPIYAIYPPTSVATAAIYLACLYTVDSSAPVALPLEPRPWWELFGVTSEEQIWQICRHLLDLYKQWDPSLLPSQAGTDGATHCTLWQRIADENVPITKSALRERLARHANNNQPVT